MPQRNLSLHKLRSVRQGALILSCGAAAPAPEIQALRKFTEQYILNEPSARVRLAEIEEAIAGAAPGFFGLEPDRVVFRPEASAVLPGLPAGYGFKGGAARTLLMRALGLSAPAAPRDLDLVRIDTCWNEQDTELSRRFMPDDFERGHGVELVSGLDFYFRSRDLSVNEVIYLDGVLTAATIAVLDMLAGVLRPCFYRAGTLHRVAELQGRVFLKTLRLLAEGLVREQDWVAVGLPENATFTDFDLALQLDKAFASGPGTAERFAEILWELGIIEAGAGNGLLCSLVAELSPSLFGGLGFFRALPEEIRARLAD